MVVTYGVIITAIRIFTKENFQEELCTTTKQNFFIVQQKVIDTVSVILLVICYTWFVTQTIASPNHWKNSVHQQKLSFSKTGMMSSM
ncbi:hypothetical protein L596_020955 [Steinernema carpocapsae]|uniref:Uncharacterized protein n=1 Tax=Steinernema carpocapsae TaxID=34508 RepID=A0A4U5MV39_STECR|nr:hypothetical protein L596_020955 [Steinernema carpocapsae]